jgi:molybdopterin/thiamine biosynthesis adenylyltransferase
MYVVCCTQIVNQCRSGEEDCGLLLGHTIDGDVYRVTGVCSRTQAAPGNEVLGVWTRSEAYPADSCDHGELVLIVEPSKTAFWRRDEEGQLQPVPSMIYDLEANLFLRLRGVVDQAQLRDRTVAIVGCGSVGSGIAGLLVAAGIGRFILIDPDRLEAHNVVRHLCGLGDLERLKVNAVADRLRDKNPEVAVTALPVDANEPGVLENALAQCDLVVAATDSPEVQLRINTMALKAGKPVLYAGVYNFAFGGEVQRVIPGRTACLRCIYDATTDLFNRVEPGEDGQTAAYDADRGQPGMCIDVGFITHLAARMVVETLLDAHDPDRNLVGDYLLWGNQRRWAFRHPLEHIWFSIPRNPACPACGGPGAIDALVAELGMDRQEACEAGQRLLASLDLAPGDEDPVSLFNDLEQEATSDGGPA